MLRRGVPCLVLAAVLLWTGTVAAQTKMTIATGVDPVFSAYYVAQEAGLFKKHGLDVRINTGPSGSAMVSFLVNNQIDSAFGSEIAGVSNHNLDPNVVVVAQATRQVRWIALVGRNIDKNNGPGRTYEGTQQRCQVVDGGYQDRRIVGFDVEYRYRGEVYMSRLDYDPGDRLRVRVSVTPAN